MINKDRIQDHPSPEYLEEMERLEFAIHAAGVGFWEAKPDSNILLCDKTCKALFGIPEKQELYYDEVIKLIHPDDVDAVMHAFQQAISGHNGGKYDMRSRTIAHGDGKLRWVHFSGRAYFNDKNEVTRFGGIAQDITAMQSGITTGAIALSQSEQQFRNIVEQAPMAIALLTGPDMVLEIGNAAIFDIWGKDASGMGKRLVDFLPEIKGQGYVELLEEVFRTGIPYYGNGAMAKLVRNGMAEEAFFNYAYTPLRSAGAISGVMVLATEVTHQIKSQKQIEASEAKLKAVIAAAPAAMALFIGRDLVVEMPNQAFIDIAAQGRDIAGKPLAEAMPELVDQPFMQLLDDVYTSGKMFEGSAVPADIIRNGIPVPHYFDFSYTPLFDADGKVYAILDITVDVTDQVRARQQIEETAVALRGAVELAQLGTWSIDLPMLQLHYSERMYEWHGFDPEKEVLKDTFAIIDVADRDRVEQALARSLDPSSDGFFDEEYTISHRETGKKRVLHAQGKILRTEDGQPIKMVGTAQDITVQRQLQWALEQEIQERTEALDASNEELQAANEELATSNEELAQLNEELNTSNQDLQQFAHVTSHDLKEPLRKMKTFLSRMEEDPENVFSDRSRSFIERINISSARMSAMIEGVLKYSTISVGGETIEPVNLENIVKNVLVDLEMIITQKRAVIEYEGLPIIQGAYILIYQLFYNLIINSLKFSKEDRDVLIRINGSVLQKDHVPFAQIELRDNGIGFDQTQSERIFSTFTRLNAKDRYEGTGLGLSLCKKIVQRHHGQIEAQGKEGEGAVFNIVLPVRQPNETI